MRALYAVLLAVLGVALLAPQAVAVEAEEGQLLFFGTITTGRGEEAMPVEGVVITVANTAGEEIGSATTDAEGNWQLEVPEPGDYVISLDIGSLPEGATLANPDNNPLERPHRGGRPLRVPFVLAGEAGAGGSFLDNFRRPLQLLVEGIKFGLIIAMTSIGLSLIFGTTGLTNFAHGELVTFGALVTWFFNAAPGGPRLHLIWSALIGTALGGVLGAGLDLGIFRPLRRRGTGLIALIVVSIGLSLVLRHIYLLQYGGRARPFSQYAQQVGLVIGPIRITPKDLISVAISLIVLIGVALILQRTRIGKAMRAVADNRDLAESSGIDVQRVILFVWILGGSLAALGGILTGLGEQVRYLMGFELLLLMFAGITLGGLGTAYGALVGSLIVGILVQMSTLWLPTEVKNATALLVLILILLVRPQGILGRAERVG